MTDDRPTADRAPRAQPRGQGSCAPRRARPGCRRAARPDRRPGRRDDPRRGGGGRRRADGHLPPLRRSGRADGDGRRGAVRRVPPHDRRRPTPGATRWRRSSRGARRMSAFALAHPGHYRALFGFQVVPGPSGRILVARRQAAGAPAFQALIDCRPARPSTPAGCKAPTRTRSRIAIWSTVHGYADLVPDAAGPHAARRADRADRARRRRSRSARGMVGAAPRCTMSTTTFDPFAGPVPRGPLPALRRLRREPAGVLVRRARLLGRVPLRGRPAGAARLRDVLGGQRPGPDHPAVPPRRPGAGRRAGSARSPP